MLLRMKNVSDKLYRENQNTHFMFGNFFSKNCSVCEIMWKNVVQLDRPLDYNVKQSMHFACWITNATNTHSEYVIQASLIVHHGYVPEKCHKS
jgi:hypothetical protein